MTNNTVTHLNAQSFLFTQDSFLQTGSQDWNFRANDKANFRTLVTTLPDYFPKEDR